MLDNILFNIFFSVVVFLLDELSHVLTQCFTARPLTLSMAVERMGAGMFLMTVDRDSKTDDEFDPFMYIKRRVDKGRKMK